MRLAKLVALATVFFMPAASWALCTTEGTTAVSVFTLSGQGNFNCADLGMSDQLTTFEDNGDGTISWRSTAPLTDNEVDAFIVEPSSGDRCVYNYGVATLSDSGLTTSNGKAVQAAFGCTDGAPAAPAPTKPFASFGDGCEVVVTCGDGPCPGIENATVALIHGLDVAGVCQVAQAVPLSPFEQVECVDQCVERVERQTGLACTPDEEGEIPIDCSRCMISEEQPPATDPSLRYCTEYTNRACGSSNDQSDYPSMEKRCLGREVYTYKPRESLGNDGDVEHYDGTTCYKSTKTSGDKTYTYSNC